ncbi:MAG: polysaccharide biosynthesis tyrosine autokinase [Nostocaceae cyanobacterium]|nr:polysaccharide biosynthesis tyrosine autokinase [Nostocaceae cyanobacterium]
MNSEKTSQLSSVYNTAQFSEDDEGGLNLGQVMAAVRRRVLLVMGITCVCTLGAGITTQTTKPIYQGEFQVLTKPLAAETEVISSVPQTLSSRRDETVSNEKTTETTIVVLKSPQVLSGVIQKLKRRYPQIDEEKFVESLTIESTKPNILEVKFKHPNDNLVRDTLDLLSKSYLEYSLDQRRADINQGLKFVEQQLPQLNSRVEIQQRRLQRLRQENNLVDPEKTGQQLSAQISDFMKQRLEIQVELEQMRAKYKDLQAELAQRPDTSAANSVLSDNPRYQKLLDTIQAVDAEIARTLAKYVDNNEPGNPLVALREQRQQLVVLLRQEGERVQRDMYSRIRQLDVRNQSVSEKIDNLNLAVKQLSIVSREYTDVQRELQIATDNLNQFLAKREALRIDAAQRQIPWQLLTPVINPKQSAANPSQNLVLGGLLGLLLGLGAAILIEKLANVLYTSKEIKEVTRLPLLGIVPLHKKLQESSFSLPNTTNLSGGFKHNQPQWQKSAPVFEVFRSLYANIRLLASDTPIRSFVISSAIEEEGKSTVAAYLAQAAAAMGQRVLLIDTNLRRPSLHQLVGIANIQGLTDVISTDLDFQNVIEQSPVEDNLYVMTAGSIPPDPIRLLASEKMQDLMDKLQAAFDIVIYDAPPILGVADATLLAAHTNGLVLVTGLGRLKRSVLERALEDLKVAGTPLLGVVANRTKEEIPTSYAHYLQSHGKSDRHRRPNDVDTGIASIIPSLPSLKAKTRRR